MMVRAEFVGSNDLFALDAHIVGNGGKENVGDGSVSGGGWIVKEDSCVEDGNYEENAQ